MKALLFLLLSAPLFALDKDFINYVKTLKDPETIAPKVECLDPEAPLYCQDFQKTVCTESDVEEMQGQLATKKAEGKKIFIDQMVALDPKMKQEVDDIYNAPVTFGDDDGMDELLSEWAKTSEAKYKKALSATSQKIFQSFNLTNTELTTIYETAKSEVIQSIQKLNIPEQKKKEFIAQIQGVVLVDIDGFFEKTKQYGQEKYPEFTPQELYEDTVLAYYGQCGPDGTHSQIFTLASRFVYVCPGMIYYLAQVAKTKEELVQTLLLFFAHEFSHTPVESKLFNPPLKACYETKLGIPDYDRFTLRQKIGMWDLQWKEIGSDALASQAVADLLSKTNLRGEALAKKLREYVIGFCAQSGQVIDDEHPGASVRMEIFARHPLIRERMGCKVPDPVHKSCQIP